MGLDGLSWDTMGVKCNWTGAPLPVTSHFNAELTRVKVKESLKTLGNRPSGSNVGSGQGERPPFSSINNYTEAMMLKKLLITTAASGLMLSAAWAQAPSPSPDRPATPPAASERPATPPAASDRPATPPAAAEKPAASEKSAASDKPAAVTQQKPDQLLASKFKGTDVLGSDNQKIGDISDILFDKQGTKIEAYVISVGGFLGMGAKDIALPPSQVQWTKDNNEDKLKVSMTKDQLKEMAKFEPYNAPRQTTGAGPGAGGGAGQRPAGGGMAK
jgi:sporulation protein YlmC with PRC-barrel domain